MGWKTEEFGESHEGYVGAVLADGSEPKPVYLDVGSGSGGHETPEWWAYNGILNRPKAAAVRSACACGWRGPSRPVDWERLDGSVYDLDTSREREDWSEHIDSVDRRTVPLPDELADLIDRLEEQLHGLSAQAPVAALKAVAALERLTHDIGRDAAFAAEADELSPESIGTALGLSADKARSRLLGYQLRSFRHS